MNIGPYTFAEFTEKARGFHGYPSPGVILGGIMVAEARRHLPENILFDAISETNKCLPDAVQLLTPCTIGNGWLRIFNFGKYAVSLYNKQTGAGIRVAIDPVKSKAFPDFNDWFFILKPKKEQDRARLMADIENGGDKILSVSKVTVNLSALEDVYEGQYAICRGCGESYPATDGDRCLACQGRSYYSAGQ